MWWFKKRKLEDITIETDLNEIRKRARILFIDDDEVPQIKILEKEGFFIHHWRDIENLNSIENGDYDIVFLDIGGIGASYSKDGAFGILQEIKKSNPSVVIIAFSGLKFDIERTKFFVLADDVLNKDARAIEIKSRIEEFLKEKFSIQFYWGKMREILKANGINESTIDKTEKQIYKTIIKKDNTHFVKWIKNTLTDEFSIKVLTMLSHKMIDLLLLNNG